MQITKKGVTAFELLHSKFDRNILLLVNLKKQLIFQIYFPRLRDSLLL